MCVSLPYVRSSAFTIGPGGVVGSSRNDVLAVGLIVVNAWISERLEDAVWCYIVKISTSC